MSGIAPAGIDYIITSSISIPRGLPSLTTTYTYASSCIDHWVQVEPDYLPKGLYSGYFGSGYGRYYDSCQAGGTQPTYSPGICPSGHSIATVTEWRTAPEAQAGRLWGAACCSSGFEYISTSDYISTHEACTSIFSTAVLAYRPVTRSSITSSAGSTYLDISLDYDATNNSTIISYGTMVAGVLSIYWQSNDLTLFESSYASALASKFNIKLATTPTATPTTFFSSPTASPGPTSTMIEPTSSASSSPSPPNDLSAGAKAGISLGAVFGALGFAVAVFLILRRRKRRHVDVQKGEGEHMTSVEAPELVEYHNPGRQE